MTRAIASRFRCLTAAGAIAAHRRSRQGIHEARIRGAWRPGDPDVTPRFVIASFAAGSNAFRDWSCEVAQRSELTPTGLARVHQLKLDRCDSEKTNDGRLGRVFPDPVIVRGPRDAPDESPAGIGTVLSGSKSAPLFTDHVPESTSERRSVA
jgi:hypothetical protein